MKSFARVALLSAVVAPFLPLPLCADPTPEERKWLEQVLFGAGPQRDERVCRRWTRTPKVALVRASAEQKKASEEAVKHLNEALAGTPIFKLDLPGKEPRPGAEAEADIRIHFAPEKELADVAQKYEFKYVRGNRGFYWAWWNDRHEMTKVVVLIADELKGAELRSMVLKELVQALGLPFESPAFSDSIFYRDGPRETRATQLSPRDRKLIVLFYNRIKPGATLAEARGEFRNW